MNPLSIIILIVIVLFTVFVIFYLCKHKGNSCGCCNGDCKKCKKNIEKIIADIKQQKR